MDTTEFLHRYTADNPALFEILYAHSRAVADLAVRIASERHLPVDLQFVEQAAMLHDIGVVECYAPSISCFGTLPYICHGIAGSRILRAEGLPEFALVAERHTGAGITSEEVVQQSLPLPAHDYLPVTLEEKLICYADKFYSKSRSFTISKPIEKIRSQMMAHGPEAAARFDELERLFGSPFC